MLAATREDLNVNTFGWTPPVYVADRRAPRVTISVVDDFHARRINDVPMPPDVRTSPDGNVSGLPGDGDDNYLVIIDGHKRCEYDFWRAYKDSRGRWHAKNQATFGLDGSGVHVPWAVRASSFALGGGLIRPRDIRRMEIDHALVVAIPLSQTDTKRVGPAQSSDGTARSGILMGTLFQLDPALNLQAFRPKLKPWQLLIARAMRDYGMYVADRTTGALALVAQSTVSTGRFDYPWPRYSTLPHEIVPLLRAVASPASRPRLDTWATSGCAQRYLVK